MKTLTIGHCYELPSLEGCNPQIIQFIQKERDPDDPTKLITVEDGTTNEAVLEVLIDRITVLNWKMPCDANLRVLEHLGAALRELKDRTAQRAARGVEGTAKP